MPRNRRQVELDQVDWSGTLLPRHKRERLGLQASFTWHRRHLAVSVCGVPATTVTGSYGSVPRRVRLG